MNREEDKGDEVTAQSAAGEALGRALTDTEPGRLLQYTCKAPAAPEGYQNRLRIVYSQAKVPSSVKANTRYIPQAPDRILDAPDILDDYYLNLVDWSASNILAVALGSHVYLWNAGTGQIEQLLSVEESETVTSLAWVQSGGTHLAVGTSTATVELWDCERIKRLRVMDGHTGRVGSLAWNVFVVSSGSRDGTIVHHDVRQRDHVISTLNGHTQEVCGLKWSPDGRYLASGGNDNLLNIWPVVQGNHHSQAQPVHSFNQHQAAVKGLAWCPWSAGVLASGGGTADRTIRLWNVNTGANLNTVDTKSQVCAILWSTNYKELISGHGYANNQLIIWKYPLMTRVAELTGHTARVLHLAMSPDGTTVLSAGADETLSHDVDPRPNLDSGCGCAVNSDRSLTLDLHPHSVRDSIFIELPKRDYAGAVRSRRDATTSYQWKFTTIRDHGYAKRITVRMRGACAVDCLSAASPPLPQVRCGTEPKRQVFSGCQYDIST
ncbi:Cell division cycle protein 20 homolog [Eumeta japonica]|uniref:Cell division cycle protein 20 homolog n=1 Tax=Eumeta variegata TaxID=151549 RepID=A0A4C1Z0M0_EUMVA|nr:Cell division cycle protein 20 homolog [Eumeta japonica]